MDNGFNANACSKIWCFQAIASARDKRTLEILQTSSQSSIADRQHRKNVSVENLMSKTR